MRVPFVDLNRQYLSIQDEIDSAIQSVISDSAFVGGRNNKYATKFEEEWAEYIAVKHVVGCANGTDALEMVLEAMEIGPGDEVIVPAMTWIATAGAVARVGASPVFVDVHPQYYTMDPASIEQAITNKTRAIVPVHLYGLPAEMDEIREVASRHNLSVIEDAAQAHGAEYKGSKAGTLADASIFSFYPGKNLGAFGDAGCLATHDPGLAEEVRRIGNHGQVAKHDFRRVGRNSRLDGLQAAILSAKLPYLEQWNEARRNVVQQYNEKVDPTKYVIPSCPPHSKTSAHLYVLQIREGFAMPTGASRLIQKHYPTRLWDYHFLGTNTNREMPIADRLARSGFSVPLFPDMRPDEIKHVINALNDQL